MRAQGLRWNNSTVNVLGQQLYYLFFDR